MLIFLTTNVESEIAHHMIDKKFISPFLNLQENNHVKINSAI